MLRRVYDSDEDHMNTMNRLLGSDEGCAKYIEDYIHSWRTHDDFIKVVVRPMRRN